MWEQRNLFNKRFNYGINTEDAFLLGYFGIHFDVSNVASKIKESAELTADPRTERRLWSEQDMGQAMSALCEGVSGIPGGTLNVVDITAMGGTKWGIAGGIDFGDTVTMKFRELSGMPMKTLFTAWANLIRHTNSGMSMLNSGDYTKKFWTATATYYVLRPNGRSVEAGIVLDGIYPMGDLGSQIYTDITSIDGQTFDVTFHVDALYFDSSTTARAQNFVNEYYEQGYNDYKHLS